jgi:hypothetical protein
MSGAQPLGLRAASILERLETAPSPFVTKYKIG